MLKFVLAPISVLILVVTGCNGGKDSAASVADWASACTDLEVRGPTTPGRIAFAAERRAGSELAVMDVASKRTRRLTRQRSPHDYVASMAWSPDGTRIAYSEGTGGWNDNAYSDIWIVSTAGGRRPLRLTDSYEDDWSPAWSPDGTKLAFDRNDDG